MVGTSIAVFVVTFQPKFKLRAWEGFAVVALLATSTGAVIAISYYDLKIMINCIRALIILSFHVSVCNFFCKKTSDDQIMQENQEASS